MKILIPFFVAFGLMVQTVHALSFPAKVNADQFLITQYPGTVVNNCRDNGATLAGIIQGSSLGINQALTIADTNGGIQATPLTIDSSGNIVFPGYQVYDGLGSPPAVSAPGTAQTYFDSSAVQLMISKNGNPYVPVGSGSTIPGANTVYVTSAGNDTTCAPNQVANPCATVIKAMSLITNPAVSSLIQIESPGTYSVDGLDFLVNVTINGIAPANTLLDFGNSGVTMDSSWSQAGQNSGGVSNLGFISSGSSQASFSFSGFSSNNYFNFNNILIPNIDLDLSGDPVNGAVVYNVTAVLSTGHGALNITDAGSIVLNSTFENNGLSVVSTNAAGQGECFTFSSSYLGNVTVDGTIGRALLFIPSGSILGNFSELGANGLCFAQMGVMPAQTALSVDAGSILEFGGDAFQVPYYPANPSAWAGTPPSSVTEALDRLAAVAVTPP